MNETIRQARQVALDILKPSQKDLEHGLELHKNSLVFESYGFSPSAAIDGDRAAEVINAGASDAEIDDMFEDMMMTRKATDPVEREEVLMAWDEAGVDCIFQNAGQEHDDPLTIMKRLARFTYAADLLRDRAPRCAAPDEIVQAWKEGKHSFYFSSNGVPLLYHWVSKPDEMRYIRLFFQLGIRMMHITYNRRNLIGDGCGEAANGGLSDFGRDVIKEMNRVGVIVDVAHSGHKTSLEAAQVSDRPMVSSHSGAHALSGHFRCKTDEILKAIAATGGYCGVCCIPRFLGGSGDISAFLDHIMYMVKLVGAESVAIGTDVGYQSSNAEAEYKKLPQRPKRREPWRSLWPGTDWEDRKWTTPQQRLSMAWTNWPLFTVGMVQRGLSDTQIQQILGLNCLRVAKANWDGRKEF
ncbi:MAG TPA: membrane dipeptidase [Candidatus Brocadiia bacterium]|nr:membrane dipeptidase [Candidatus Brocadiia bacterium]